MYETPHEKKAPPAAPGQLFPRKVRLSFRMVLLCALFTLFVGIVLCGVAVLCTEPISMEDGAPMSPSSKIFFITVSLAVVIGYLFMIVPLWKRIFRGGAMILTRKGIENSFVIFSVFAFWTLLPVCRIPWSALRPDGSENGGYSVDVQRLPPGSAGKLAKFLLKVSGFPYRIGKIRFEELERCRRTALGLLEEEIFTEIDSCGGQDP